MMLLRRCPDGVGDGELGHDDLRLPWGWPPRLADSRGEHDDLHLGHRGWPAGGALGAYLAFSAWYISDSESDFDKFIRVINQIPYPGGSRTGTIAKALFDALSSALDWTTPGGVK